MNKIVKYLKGVWQKLTRRIPANVTVVEKVTCTYSNRPETVACLLKNSIAPSMSFILYDKNDFLKLFK